MKSKQGPRTTNEPNVSISIVYQIERKKTKEKEDYYLSSKYHQVNTDCKKQKQREKKNTN